MGARTLSAGYWWTTAVDPVQKITPWAYVALGANDCMQIRTDCSEHYWGDYDRDGLNLDKRFSLSDRLSALRN